MFWSSCANVWTGTPIFGPAPEVERGPQLVRFDGREAEGVGVDGNPAGGVDDEERSVEGAPEEESGRSAHRSALPVEAVEFAPDGAGEVAQLLAVEVERGPRSVRGVDVDAGPVRGDAGADAEGGAGGVYGVHDGEGEG